MSLENVADELVRLRTANGKSIDDAAAASGIDPERLGEAEAALTALEMDELTALAEPYGVGMEAFFGGRSTPDREL